MKQEIKPIVFPKDGMKHDSVGEWWYFNGHLKDERGNSYSYMNTLFRARLPLNISGKLKKIPSKNIYFYHSIISDIEQNKFYPHIDYVSLVSKDSFKGPLLRVYFTDMSKVNYNAYYIEEREKFNYRIKGKNLNLELKSEKKPLLENQTGYVVNLGKSTYYYSLTNLSTRGTINVNDKEIKVSGKSWIDHQWSNSIVSKDYWNWFCIQLDNNLEIVCYEYGRRDQSTFLATILYPDNSQKTFRNIKITPLSNKWRSRKTKATYDLDWIIEIPEANIVLKTKSKVTNHEMNFLNINYWEGPFEVKALINKRQVLGDGYMEINGRPSVFSNVGFLKKELKSKIRTKTKQAEKIIKNKLRKSK